MSCRLLVLLALCGSLAGCEAWVKTATTSAEVDAAFVMCSHFGGLTSFKTYDRTADLNKGRVKDVEAKCRDGAWVGRRIHEVITDKAPIAEPHKAS